MSIRLASVVAHVRVNAVAWAMGMGGCVYSHDCTSCMVCKHMHVYFGVKHTVLISVKKILSLALNNARAQNNGQFWMLTNIYAQGGITGFYSCYSKYNMKRAYHIRRCTSRPIHNASNAAISDQRSATSDQLRDQSPRQLSIHNVHVLATSCPPQPW